MTRIKSFSVISKRLASLFTVAVLLVIALVFVLNNQQANYIKSSNDLGAIINKSGRQRMLSQLLTKEIVIAKQTGLTSEKILELDSILGLFESSNQLLLDKSSQISRQELTDLFAKINQPYQQIVEQSRAFVLQDTLVFEMDDLLAAEQAFLPLMDSITLQFEQEESRLLYQINETVSYSNYIVAIAVLLSGSLVFFITITIIRNFATKLKLVEEELKRSLESEKNKVQKFQFLTNTIQVGIWEKDLRDSTEKWSDRLYEILGYTKEEYKGTADEFMGLVHPADLPKLQEASAGSIATGKPATVELRVKKSHREYIWVEASGNAKRGDDGNVELLIGGVQEITDRKLLEVQLRVFIERAPAAIAMFDTDMRYLAASHKWKEDYAIIDQEIIGRSHYDVFPEIGDDWKEVHQKCLKGHVDVNEEDPFEREDGSLQYIKWEVRPWYRSEEQVGGILMFTQDVTQSIREKEELKKAKKEAEAAAKSREDFLATMSHEIRTPLNAIIGISHILQMEDHKPEQADQIRLLRFSGENLLSLINDILDISKINSGKIELSLSNFDLKYLVENINNSLVFKAKENMVDLRVHYDESLPNHFVGDVTRIAQIMNNLIGNAIKFTNNGQVLVSVVKVDLSDEFIKLRLSVKDTGIGIDPANIEKIFNSFEQAEEGTTRRFGGTGLGLFIAKKLVELMESTIHVESELGKGSTFYFDLELPPVTEEQSEERAEVRSSGFERMDLNILVAEDNTANQVIVMKYLNAVGISYDIVSDGAKALELIHSMEYDIVFMDLQMPVMDGYEATRAIRNLSGSYFKDIPIVALTADAFADIKGHIQVIGMSDFLSKPFRPSMLYDIIKRNAGKVKPKKRKLNLAVVLDELADGDIAFRETFSKQCLESYTEFFLAFNVLLVESDKVELGKISHKIKSLNTQFGLFGLQEALDVLKDEDDYTSNKVTIKKVLEITKEVINELKKQLAS